MSTPDDNFIACLAETLRQECPKPEDWSNARNYSNDAHDPGGETMCGITQREYSAWRLRHALPSQHVRLLSREEGIAIYRGYWLPYCPMLPRGLDLQLFDESVNAGLHAAIEILQDALGIASDGVWGPQTAKAVAITNVEQLVQRYTICRHARYRRTRGYEYFHVDWDRRCNEIGAAALVMMRGAANVERTAANVAPAIAFTTPMSGTVPDKFAEFLRSLSSALGDRR